MFIFRFSLDVSPACLQQDENEQNYQLVGMGYGQTSFAGPQSNKLLKVFLTVVDSSQCNKAYEDDYDLPQGITSSQICAWDEKGIQDTW
jgi:hypothetical protein